MKTNRSPKLEKLFSHIEEKDDLEVAHEVFDSCSSMCLDHHLTPEEVLDNLENNNLIYFKVVGPFFGEDNLENVYLFNTDMREVQWYNTILRKWCADTGRKIKKK